MIEVAPTRQAQEAYQAAHEARAAAFAGLLRGLLFRSADPKGTYGTVPLT